MKVVCDRAALLEAVNAVASVVPSRSPSPVLSCLRLMASGGEGAGMLTVAGTDNETSLIVSIAEVEVQEAGGAVIPADKLRQIVQAEDGEPTLTIHTDGELVHIRGAGAHFRVYGHPPGDFPPIPDFAAVLGSSGRDAPKTVFRQKAGELVEHVNRTAFATARETSRYAFNGVLLKRDGKKLELVATDGRRLALSRAGVQPGGTGDETPVQAIIPTKALNLISKLVTDADEPVRVALTETKVHFALGPDDPGAAPRALLSSTLVEGAFPPYEDVIPRDQNRRITAGRDDLGRAIRRAAVLTNEESRGVRMTFSAKDRSVRLSSRAPEMGEAEIDVALAGYEGEDIEISFNPQFIADVLRALQDDEVIVELKAPNKPGIIRSGNDFLYVVMPVTLPQ